MTKKLFLHLCLVLLSLSSSLVAAHLQQSVGAASPPDQPSNVSPSDGETGVSPSATLEASAFSDADASDSHTASRWQITTTPGDYSDCVFDSGDVIFDLVQIQVDPVLDLSSEYYWHVCYQDSSGDWSDWSIETSFTTAVSPPQQPTNISPPDEITGVSLTPTLQASIFLDPDPLDTHAASRWQILNLSGSVYDSRVDTMNLETIVVPQTLNYSTDYVWHVCYQDSSGDWSVWSAYTYFTTTGLRPPTIDGVTPAQGRRGQSVSGVTITGGNFTEDAVPGFGPGTTVDKFMVDDSTQITADISISASATVGSRHVSVTTETGTGDLSGGFQVQSPRWDINQDLKVDYKDLAMMGASYGTHDGDPGYRANVDLNEDGAVDDEDLAILQANYGESYEVGITVIPDDGQYVLDLSQSVTVVFSDQITEDDFSFSIKPDPGGWETVWLKKGEIVQLRHSTPFQAPKEYQLSVFLDPAGQSKAVAFKAFGPSSLDLIDEQEASGQLDLDHAWTYRIWALFNPGLLPVEYQSPTPIVCGTLVQRGFEEVKDSLQPETVASLKPYLVRPTDPESIYTEWASVTGNTAVQADGASPEASLVPAAGPPTWYSADSTIHPIKVWSSQSQAAADGLRETIDDEIYGRFQVLMPHEPLSDLYVTNPDGLPDNGGDGRLDIYLVPPAAPYFTEHGPAKGVCHGLVGGQQTGPVYLLIDETPPGNELEAYTAHELFHAFQFACDQYEPGWWMEATATWAMNFIYPTNNLEQQWLPQVFSTDGRQRTLTGPGMEYGAYIFPLYLSSNYGDEIIGHIWHLCESEDGDNALGAIKDMLPPNFDEVFREFALLNYDDSVNYSHSKYSEPLSTLNRHSEAVYYLEKSHESVQIELKHLSASYVRVYNSYPGKGTVVRFDLEEFSKNPNVSIQAIVFGKSGHKEPESWTGLTEKILDTSTEEQSFSSIVVIFSYTGDGPNDFINKPLNIDVGGWKLEFTYTSTGNGYYEDTWTSVPQPGSDYVQTWTDRKWETRTYSITLKAFLKPLASTSYAWWDGGWEPWEPYLSESVDVKIQDDCSMSRYSEFSDTDGNSDSWEGSVSWTMQYENAALPVCAFVILAPDPDLTAQTGKASYKLVAADFFASLLPPDGEIVHDCGVPVPYQYTASGDDGSCGEDQLRCPYNCSGTVTNSSIDAFLPAGPFANYILWVMGGLQPTVVGNGGTPNSGTWSSSGILSSGGPGWALNECNIGAVLNGGLPGYWRDPNYAPYTHYMEWTLTRDWL